MENLGLFIYLCSILDGLRIIIGICMSASFLIGGICYIISYLEQENKYFKVANKSAIIFVCLAFALVITPSKKTCYQIFGVTKAVEIYQNSEELQKLPEKSIEAFNKILDSIISEEDAEK